MNTVQVTLFEPPGNPLEDRLGGDFFDRLPRVPGVYLMYGSSGRLLYVGKAKNLRTRLFSYRRVTSEKGSRKVRRLVQMTAEIEVQQCTSEEAALLKENTLIQEHKPEFNHAKKAPETYYFLTLRPSGTAYDFSLKMQRPDRGDGLSFTYGAFKGHRTVRRGSGALLRQLYLLEHNVQSAFDFPAVLTNQLTPLEYRLPIRCKTMGDKVLHRFLTGESTELLNCLVDQATARNLFAKYIGRLILNDCDALKKVYDRCFHRNFRIRQAIGLQERLIPQYKLDDYLIRLAFRDKKNNPLRPLQL